MFNFGLRVIHISGIRQGDTVVHNGEALTVSGNNIKRDSFMGTSIFGDSYNIGHKPVYILSK